MQIQSLTLYTNQLAEQRYFFTQQMSFEISEESITAFGIQVGKTTLRFVEAPIQGKYHYCFLIPSNQLDASIKWLRDRDIPIIKIEGDRIVQHFANWNADSVYFYDGAGNLVEFIVRYNLDNDHPEPFDQQQILNVNEIGMASRHPKQLNDQLTERIGSLFWKGDLERFGTFGSESGLLLLVNSQVKTDWFPTTIPTLPLPFDAELLVDSKIYPITYEKENLYF
jgi:catechol 2,3-dioxygenase-like lactoylglutathione lyase family enzyme